MKLKPDEILDELREHGFEAAWLAGAERLPKTGPGIPLKGKGKVHPVLDLAQRLREAFLGMGFDEVLLPTIVEEHEVYKQYGPEAPIILDRCYYLATIPRPDIGLSNEKCERIRALGVPLDDTNIEAMQDVLHDYKRGDLDADDLVEKFMESLGTSDFNAIRVVREVFPELTVLKPIPTKLTLRSHLTSTWFNTLSVLQHQMTHPIKLFSVGVRFRREQSEDTTHLRTHFGASCTIVGEEVTIDDGKRVAEALLGHFGFQEPKFEQKKTTSKYYAPGTEYEVFVKTPNAEKWIEVVDLGSYSPVALARYDIEYPVLNLGLGVERLGMLLAGKEDIRSLAYPQFYGQWTITDNELARMVRIGQTPQTAGGMIIWRAIVQTARTEAERASPCEVVAYEGQMLGRNVRVTVYEPDEKTKLLGPAALNTIYVLDGDILGVPPSGMDNVKAVKEAREKGVSTGITYLDAVAALAAAKIEVEAARDTPKDLELRIRIAKLPSDVNVEISDVANRYITGKQKKVVVKGPTFIGVKARFLRP